MCRLKTWCLCAVLLLPALWSGAGEECEFLGLSAGGSIYMGNCSPHDPNVLTVATDMSGAFITYDAGAKWHMIDCRQLSCSNSCCAVFHPTKPDVIYWVKGTEVRVSKDRGVTWEPAGAGQPWRERKDVQVAVKRLWLDPDYPERIFVGLAGKADAGQLWLSADESKSWRECPGSAGVVFRVAVERQSPAAQRVYFVGASDGFFRSDDGAKTFTRKMEGLPSGGLTGFAAGSNEKQTILYAAVPCVLKDGKLTGGMYRSKDKGETWQRCMNAKINQETKRSSEWAAGDLPQYTWVAAGDKMPERAYVFCSGTSYHPPCHATFYRTDDAGESWQEVFFSDPRFKNKGMECNVETDWETECWGQRQQGATRGCEINPANPDMFVVNQGRFIHYTLDAGKTWKSPYRGTSRVDAEGHTHWANSGEVVTSTWNYYIDPFDKSRHYICYTDIGFARSLDGGKTWLPEMYHIPKNWSNTTYELAFDPEVPGRVWGAFSASHDIPNYNAIYGGHSPGGPGGIALSNDHCATWTKLKLPVALPAISIVVDPKSPKEKRTLYASFFGGGVFRSSDGGATWEAKSSGLDNDKRCLKLVLHQDGTLFVASTGKVKQSPAGTGIFRSTDKAETWTKITAGQPWDWIRDYAVKSDDSQTILVPTARTDPGLHRTTDGGKTWQTTYKDEKERYFFGACYHPVNKDWIYLTVTEGSGDYSLFLSKDAGANWQPFKQVPFGNIQRITFDPDDPKHMYLSTFGASIIKAPVEP
ncbi:MAG: hypothetical protein ABSE73_24630 [Planctomycetota bacterium]